MEALLCFNMGWQTLVFYTNDGKDSNLYLRLRAMSHTIHTAKFEQTITHQHVFLRREIQSSIDGVSVTIILFASFNCTSHIY